MLRACVLRFCSAQRGRFTVNRVGMRGCSRGDVARIADAANRLYPLVLERVRSVEYGRLFGSAYNDGCVFVVAVPGAVFFYRWVDHGLSGGACRCGYLCGVYDDGRVVCDGGCSSKNVGGWLGDRALCAYDGLLAVASLFNPDVVGEVSYLAYLVEDPVFEALAPREGESLLHWFYEMVA